MNNFKTFFTVLSITLLTGCSTLEYRDVQQDFNTAVQNDNISSAVPGSDPHALYSSVIINLSQSFINKHRCPGFTFHP